MAVIPGTQTSHKGHSEVVIVGNHRDGPSFLPSFQSPLYQRRLYSLGNGSRRPNFRDGVVARSRPWTWGIAAEWVETTTDDSHCQLGWRRSRSLTTS